MNADLASKNTPVGVLKTLDSGSFREDATDCSCGNKHEGMVFRKLATPLAGVWTHVAYCNEGGVQRQLLRELRKAPASDSAAYE